MYKMIQIIIGIYQIKIINLVKIIQLKITKKKKDIVEERLIQKMKEFINAQIVIKVIYQDQL